MTGRTRAIIGVIVMSALLVLYFVFVGVRAVALLGSGSLIAVLMGLALLFLPILGMWALVREVDFGRRATRLVDQLAEEGNLPQFEPRDDRRSSTPSTQGDQAGSGQPQRQRQGTERQHERALADAAFPRFRAEVEAAPDSWRAWMRLGIAYDVAGDRRRARSATRRAIAAFRAQPS